MWLQGDGEEDSGGLRCRASQAMWRRLLFRIENYSYGLSPEFDVSKFELNPQVSVRLLLLTRVCIFKNTELKLLQLKFIIRFLLRERIVLRLIIAFLNW